MNADIPNASKTNDEIPTSNENITSNAIWSGRMIECSQQVKAPRQSRPLWALINEPAVVLSGRMKLTLSSL
jgi:hypothetical protein